MDGVRAYWDGKRLLSKQGKELNVPKKFTFGLPSGIELDGELWMGRGTYEKLVSILHSNNQDWDKVQYHIFDFPSSKGNMSERMVQLKQIQLPPQVHESVSKSLSYTYKAHAVDNSLCIGREHLQEVLNTVSDSDGEGLMLSNPLSLHQLGCTDSILKVKVGKCVM